MAVDYSKSLYNLHEELLNKFEQQKKLLKETNNIVKLFNKTIDSLYEIINELKK